MLGYDYCAVVQVVVVYVAKKCRSSGEEPVPASKGPEVPHSGYVVYVALLDLSP